MTHKENGYRNIMVSTETFEDLSRLADAFRAEHPVMKRVSKAMLIGALVQEAAAHGVKVGKDRIGPVDG